VTIHRSGSEKLQGESAGDVALERLFGESATANLARDYAFKASQCELANWVPNEMVRRFEKINADDFGGDIQRRIINQ